MENQNIKCSNKEHKEINPVFYCRECNIYMCNKCENFHSKLFDNHHFFNLDNNINNIFIDLCQKEHHNQKLEFFCKTHNKLCCGLCITKIKKEGKGQHSDCDICLIENISEEKKLKLKKNIKFLEEFLNTITKSIEQIKELFEKININKEELKLKLLRVFTEIRNAVNEREDELLLEIDKKFEDMYIKEDIIKDYDKLPNKVKISLEKGKKIEKEEWNDNNKLIFLINDCINIENNIKDINLVNENIKKLEFKKKFNEQLIFYPEEKSEIKEFINKLKTFGNISVCKCLNIFNDSLIINKNKQYIDSLIKWLNPKNDIKANLLYRKSKDGDSYDIFHKLCDNQGPTLILIKGAEGFIFGGYTPLDWDDNSRWKKDDETFLFSLTNNKIYNKSDKSKNSIYCYKLQGPWFPFIGFGSFGKHNMSQGKFEPKSQYFKDYIDIIPNNGEEKFFDVEEVEIYKISFI